MLFQWASSDETPKKLCLRAAWRRSEQRATLVALSDAAARHHLRAFSVCNCCSVLCYGLVSMGICVEWYGIGTDLNGTSAVFEWANLHAFHEFDPLSFLILILA